MRTITIALGPYVSDKTLAERERTIRCPYVEGQVLFASERTCVGPHPGNRAVTVDVSDWPETTNLSGERRLWGWCGTTDDVHIEAEGLVVVDGVETERDVEYRLDGEVPVATHRVSLRAIEKASDEEATLLDHLGYEAVEESHGVVRLSGERVEVAS